jgi:hypothetical protein
VSATGPGIKKLPFGTGDRVLNSCLGDVIYAIWNPSYEQATISVGLMGPSTTAMSMVVDRDSNSIKLDRETGTEVLLVSVGMGGPHESLGTLAQADFSVPSSGGKWGFRSSRGGDLEAITAIGCREPGH